MPFHLPKFEGALECIFVWMEVRFSENTGAFSLSETRAKETLTQGATSLTEALTSLCESCSFEKRVESREVVHTCGGGFQGRPSVTSMWIGAAAPSDPRIATMLRLRTREEVRPAQPKDKTAAQHKTSILVQSART